MRIALPTLLLLLAASSLIESRPLRLPDAALSPRHNRHSNHGGSNSEASPNPRPEGDTFNTEEGSQDQASQISSSPSARRTSSTAAVGGQESQSTSPASSGNTPAQPGQGLEVGIVQAIPNDPGRSPLLTSIPPIDPARFESASAEVKASAAAAANGDSQAATLSNQALPSTTCTASNEQATAAVAAVGAQDTALLPSANGQIAQAPVSQNSATTSEGVSATTFPLVGPDTPSQASAGGQVAPLSPTITYSMVIGTPDPRPASGSVSGNNNAGPGAAEDGENDSADDEPETVTVTQTVTAGVGAGAASNLPVASAAAAQAGADGASAPGNRMSKHRSSTAQMSTPCTSMPASAGVGGNSLSQNPQAPEATSASTSSPSPAAVNTQAPSPGVLSIPIQSGEPLFTLTITDPAGPAGGQPAATALPALEGAQPVGPEQPNAANPVPIVALDKRWVVPAGGLGDGGADRRWVVPEGGYGTGGKKWVVPEGGFGSRGTDEKKRWVVPGNGEGELVERHWVVDVPEPTLIQRRG